MKNWLVNLGLAAAITALFCWLSIKLLEWLLVPCILKGDPRPPDYPAYCDAVGRLPSGLLQFWFVIPLVVFFVCVWIFKRLRK